MKQSLLPSKPLVRHWHWYNSWLVYLGVIAWKILRGDQTFRLQYPLTEQSIVVDVGGYLGDWSQAIHDRYQPKIYIFEPVPVFVEKLRHRFANHKSIQIFAYGLAGQAERIKIKPTDDATSVFGEGPTQEATPETTPEATLEIDLQPASQTFRSLGLNSIDLLKLNIEGAEYALIADLIKSGYIRQVNNLQVQFHHFVPGARQLRQALHRELSQTHRLTYSFPFIWENWQRLPLTVSSVKFSQPKSHHRQSSQGRPSEA
ncbi:MAG: FkbM family methyltransferase [Candidatus Berkelbacteria bacterium Gr01-1014_85]|uniref:FkbM family methyltransferase n=1 Tax=Candidatus Berkelbacteria bacterium Gr01-1014_85 TaxID=2017150 RepID=A0A554JC12_9BACT|nr:MAG: FkbM family methyltransferase [Candidatus Berkelbacteria bacterium Gr01-1014_85]